MMDLSSGIEFITAELEKTDLRVQSWHWVNVTHIINPGNFYVRMTTYLPFIEKIELNKPLVRCSSVDIGDLVIINLNDMNEDEKYARGKIILMKNEAKSVMCDVFLLDYGYIKRLVPMKNIWQVYNQELCQVPSLVLLCRLGNCAPIGGGTEWTERSIDAFKFYVGTERARMLILDKSNSQLTVQLYNSAPDDMATLLAYTEYSTFGYVKNNGNNIF